MMRAAYVIAQAATTMCELQGMILANKLDEQFGRPLTFPPSRFFELPENQMLTHNQVLTYLRGG